MEYLPKEIVATVLTFFDELDTFPFLFVNKFLHQMVGSKNICYGNIFMSFHSVRHLPYIHWLREFKFKWVGVSNVNAVHHKNLETLILLEKMGLFYGTSTTFDAAALTGDLDIMKWFVQKNFFKSTNASAYAAKNGNLENMKWLNDNGFIFYEFTFSMAVKNGNIENLEWLKEIKCPIDYTAYKSCSDLKVADWLFANNCPIAYITVFHHIRFRDLEILKWYKLHGEVFDKYAFKVAAMYARGNMEIMQWLKDIGCTWDHHTFDAAAAHGDRVALEWLEKNGCPWGISTFLSAIENGNESNLKWLVDNGCPSHEI